ncbi:MAG: hypothetical protein ABJG86_13495 [Nitratireductor sp.]|uniref:hypothetical protein n=1 Tax=Alphaproteobacteria TaxID=28211 RepID=UPI00326A14E7
MLKLVPRTLSISVIAYLALAGGPVTDFLLDIVQSFSPQSAEFLRPLISSRTIVFAIGMIIAALLWRPVWATIWKLPIVGSAASTWLFPDLHGTWEIEMNSNWPIIEKVRNAAKGAESGRYDVLAEDAEIPELQLVTLRAKISHTWRGVSLSIDPSPSSVLLESRTLSIDLLPASQERPKRLVWLYRQVNKQPRLPTDEQKFYGSAILSVSEDGKSMDGNYWTNRSWDRGLNAAGLITAKRV